MWRRVAIVVFVVLPVLLPFIGISLSIFLNPHGIPLGSDRWMWAWFILPIVSAVTYGVSVYARFRGYSWSWAARAAAVLAILPGLVMSYLGFLLFLVVVFHAIAHGNARFAGYM